MAVAGSMAYIAPEILERRGYLSSIDWWSLGVVMYEMVFQCRPFRSKTTEGLQSAILTEEIYFSSSMSTICSAECIDCIKGFLTRDITKRLGVKEMGGYETIKKHPFFKSINWDDLEQKKIKPPFVPEVKKTNFDASHELEELLSVNQPTQQIKRKSINSTSKSRGSGQKPVRKENSKVSQDYFDAMINLMNEKFTCYDFTKAQPFLGIVTESSSLDYLGKFGKLKASERDLSFDIMEGRSEDLNMSGVESNYSNVHSMNGSSSQNAQIQGLSSRSRNQSQKMSNTEKIPDLPNSELIQREKQGDIVSQ